MLTHKEVDTDAPEEVDADDPLTPFVGALIARALIFGV